jgi:hypothetical protein
VQVDHGGDVERFRTHAPQGLTSIFDCDFFTTFSTNQLWVPDHSLGSQLFEIV